MKRIGLTIEDTDTVMAAVCGTIPLLKEQLLVSDYEKEKADRIKANLAKLKVMRLQ